MRPNCRKAITVSAILRGFEIDIIDVWKVDVESQSPNVADACEWLKDVRCVMIKTHDRFRPRPFKLCTVVFGAPQLRRVKPLVLTRKNEVLKPCGSDCPTGARGPLTSALF